MPVTGPNGEQGFAPVPMQMPQPMPFPHQQAPNGSAAAPVQFVQGPNGFFMPVSAAPQPQPASAAFPAQPVMATATSPSAAVGALSEVELAGSSVMSANPFEPQAALQRRQWPQKIPTIGDAVDGAPGTASGQAGGSALGQPAAAADSAAGAQTSLHKAPASSPGRPSNVSSTTSLSRPDSSNSLGTAGEDGGFRTASDGSLAGQQCADVLGPCHSVVHDNALLTNNDSDAFPALTSCPAIVLPKW